MSPNTLEVTQQRINKDTKLKLAAIARLEGRSTRQQLKVIIDREAKAYPELGVME